MSLTLDLSKFKAKTEKKLEQVVKKTFIDLSSAVILDTPVDSGRLRNNWFPAINKFDDSVTESIDKTGIKAISEVVINANTFRIGDTLTLSNNLDYAFRIEYLGWSKYKAPKGMLRLNIAKFQIMVDKNTKVLK